MARQKRSPECSKPPRCHRFFSAGEAEAGVRDEIQHGQEARGQAIFQPPALPFLLRAAGRRAARYGAARRRHAAAAVLPKLIRRHGHQRPPAGNRKQPRFPPLHRRRSRHSSAITPIRTQPPSPFRATPQLRSAACRLLAHATRHPRAMAQARHAARAWCAAAPAHALTSFDTPVRRERSILPSFRHAARDSLSQLHGRGMPQKRRRGQGRRGRGRHKAFPPASSPNRLPVWGPTAHAIFHPPQNAVREQEAVHEAEHPASAGTPGNGI